MNSDNPKETDKSRKRIVVLSGGTGGVTVLSGLKRHAVDLSAIVTMSDNGGSTGVLRNEYGVLPAGDIRQCLVALSAGDELMRRLLIYRFNDGPFAGHNFGNVLLAALEKVCGNPLMAVSQAHRILNVRGQVIPVSSVASNLYAELADSTVVEGEHAIDQPTGKRAPIRRCFLDPPVEANPEAINAIRAADMIIMGPGDLYSSLIPVLLVDGMAEAMAESQAFKLYIVNLVTKRGETDGYTARRFCEVVDSYLSPARIDGAVINTGEPSSELMRRYTEAGERMVADDLTDAPKDVWRAPLISDRIAKSVPGDAVQRSLLRHDPLKLAETIMSVLKERCP